MLFAYWERQESTVKNVLEDTSAFPSHVESYMHCLKFQCKNNFYLRSCRKMFLQKLHHNSGCFIEILFYLFCLYSLQVLKWRNSFVLKDAWEEICFLFFCIGCQTDSSLYFKKNTFFLLSYFLKFISDGVVCYAGMATYSSYFTSKVKYCSASWFGCLLDCIIYVDPAWRSVEGKWTSESWM